MIEFKHPTVEDRLWMEPYFKASNCRGSECSFANLIFWGKSFGEIAKVGDFLVQFLKMRGEKYYSFPIGSLDGDLAYTVQALMEDAKSYGHPLQFLGVSCQRRGKLEELFPGQFAFKPLRDNFDYLYDIHRLADLGGKKLQPKRNHCNKFVQNHQNWSVVPISRENLGICRQFAADWFAENSQDGTDFTLEITAIHRAFDQFELLHMEGLLLFADETPVAFTMGSFVTEDTFDVHFEKAKWDIQGAYPMINREFARYLRRKYIEIKYLNREDDLGLEGLRKSKMSYYPDVLLEKAAAIYMGETGGTP